MNMDKSKIYHFTGIKGSGMSALALVLHGEGYSVQGSDLENYFFTQKGFLMPWSYNRFVELQRKICIPLVAFLKNESPRVRC